MRFLVAALVCISVSSFAYDIPFHKLESTDGGFIPLTSQQEDATIQGLTAAILSQIVDVRDAHPKAHACVDDSVFTVDKDLNKNYRAGVFANPGQQFSAVVRFSHGSSDPLADDRGRGPHGMAVKIMLPKELQNQVPDIPGEKYFVEKEYYKSFDIITINAVREWLVNDLASYGHFLKAVAKVAATTKELKAQGAGTLEIAGKSLAIMESDFVSHVPAVLQNNVRYLLLAIGGTKTENLLHNDYNSWVPYAFDEDRAVKYTWAACPNEASPRAVEDTANVLGDRLRRDLSAKKGSLCFDLIARFRGWWMPSVESPTLPWVGWNSDVRLGRLVLGSHTMDTEKCEMLSFNPGHALPNQRGIGSTQRARRVIYAAVETRRNENRGRKEVKE